MIFKKGKMYKEIRCSDAESLRVEIAAEIEYYDLGLGFDFGIR